MGTKIHTNPFLREYHSVIDLDSSTNNAMRSSYNENGMLQNGKNPNSMRCYDIEKVRQTILEHESIFRNQLRELHRLYGRQRELMSEITRRGINKDNDVMGEKFELSYLLSPFPNENAKRSWNSSIHSLTRGGPYNLGFQADLYKFSIVGSTSEKRNHLAACEADDKFSLSLSSRNGYGGDRSLTNPTIRVPDRLTLPRADMSANSWSNLNLVTKDFFHDSLDRINKEGSITVRGLRNERSGKEHQSDDYAEKRKIDKHSSLGDLCSGKSLAFPRSLLAEPRKEFPNSPLDIGTSLSRKKKKIFGVEIYEGNDDAFNSTSIMSSDLDRRAGPPGQNHRVPTLEPSSSFADSLVQNLSLLRPANQNDGKNERSEAGLKGEISRLSCHSGMNGKWLDGDSEKDFKNVDNAILKKDLEHSHQKSRDMIPRHHMLADRQSNQENAKKSLPWFLRDSETCSDLNNGKSSYFMNLDSLQSCSVKFFNKKPDDTLQTSTQKKEVKGEMNEANCSSTGNDFDRRVEINEIDLRHCIDLNLSVDEEDAQSAPSLPSAIVKIATTEIDLEAPAATESDVDASPEERDSKESNMLPANPESPYEECDKVAAEVMIVISSFVEQKLDDDDSFTSLEWFANVISSERRDAAVAVEEQEPVPTDMDDFEFMTLKLEDAKEEHHHYQPFVLKAPSDDEAGAALTRRTRRGQSRRGRQRRDFQRDILPGLVTLSRLQVTEDFQAFDELLKAGGSTCQSGISHRGSARNGRGRKRLGGATVKAPCSSQAEQPACQIEERGLAGWGKKTRRLPRQRCPNALISFPVKC